MFENSQKSNKLRKFWNKSAAKSRLSNAKSGVILKIKSIQFWCLLVITDE